MGKFSCHVATVPTAVCCSGDKLFPLKICLSFSLAMYCIAECQFRDVSNCHVQTLKIVLVADPLTHRQHRL